MMSSKQYKFAVIFYSLLTGAVGVAVGYFWAAKTAAEHMREILK